MAKILVIDDERAIRNTLKDILEFEGYTVDLAENGKQGLEKAMATTYDLIYTDIKMPEMDGIEMLQIYRQTVKENGAEESPVVMISGHGTVETAVDALKKGAFDFIVKPLDLNRLLLTTQHAIEHKSLVQETKVLRKKINSRNQMIGESAAIEQVRTIIEKVAPTEARVLITGANGTGKTTFTEYLSTKPTVGVIHVDKLTGEVKKKYFRMFLQSNDKNNTETTKTNPKLRPGAKAIFYKNKTMFNILMAIRNKLISNELNKRIDDFKKQGKSLVVIDDWAITTQKELMPELSHIYYMYRDFGVRRKSLKDRDNISEEEAKLYDLPYALKFVRPPKRDSGKVTYISNKGTIEELYAKAEEVYRQRGEHTFDERYSLRGKVNFRDVAIKLGKIKELNQKERDED